MTVVLTVGASVLALRAWSGLPPRSTRAATPTSQPTKGVRLDSELKLADEVDAPSVPVVVGHPIVRSVNTRAPRLRVARGKPLQAMKFRAPNGMRGWRVRLAARRPLATPAIADGRVFFGGGFGSYEFYALDAATGKLAWQIKTTDDGPTAAIVEDGVVIYNTESCTVEAVNARSGKRLWSRYLGDPLMSQPSANRGKVFMAYPGQDGQHYLICMALKTGATLWQSAINGDIISAPIVEGEAVYLATLDGALYRYDAATGKQAWKMARNATSAPWVQGKELFTTLRETNVGGVPVPPGTSLDEARAKLPDYPGQDNHLAPIEHYEGFARLDERGRIVQRGVCERAANYLSATDNAKKASGAKAQAYDAGVGFADAPGTAKIAQAQANIGANTVSEVWAYQGSRPVVRGGRSFSAQNEVLQCLEAATGRALWQLRLPEDKRSARTLTPPSLAGDKLFFGTSRGEIGCAQASDGQLLWIYNAGSPILFQPAVMRGRVYFGTEDGCVFCLDTGDAGADGWAMWGGNAGHNGWTKRSVS